jgi:hypothetical protein
MSKHTHTKGTGPKGAGRGQEQRGANGGATVPYTTALNMFYTLKSKYLNQKVKDKSKGLKCVGCGKHVGSVFSAKEVQEKDFYGRRLIARCGSADGPCKLNISIDIGHFHPFVPEIHRYQAEIAEKKTDVIAQKNDSIFFTNTDGAVEAFSKTVDELKESVRMYTAYRDQYEASVGRPSNDALIAELHAKIYENGQLLNEYAKNRSADALTTLMTNYIHQIRPLARRIETNRYAETSVGEIEKTNCTIYVLRQHANTIADTIFPENGPDEYHVRHFSVG